MISIGVNKTNVTYDEKSLRYKIEKEGAVWEWMEGHYPFLEYEEGVALFEDCQSIRHEVVENGIGKGIRCCFKGFNIKGAVIPYEFETYVWIESSTEDIYFEWIPICEEGLRVTNVYWPGPMSFEERKDSWYTLLNYEQGLLIPNTWETELGDLLFDGFFGTAGSYMPWISQVKDRQGYLAVCITPWDAGCYAQHPANGPYTHVGIKFFQSLGRMDYKRVLRYTFLNDCDYNNICKLYRNYVKEQGKLCTLKEKAIQAPAVDELIGCSFVHTGIKTYVREDSDFFDPEKPDKNNGLVTFAEREKQIRAFHEAGAQKIYLHLDGWAQPGYDNQHPDYLPACQEAGGWEGMRSLVNTLHEYGDLFGIHDQYRDYYVSSPSYDDEYACRLSDGSIPTHKRWAGGLQAYLCATQAAYYVKRNFRELKKQGVHLDCTYLDVFTCNEGDECANPRHRMSRKDCYEARNRCFDFFLSQGILPSSEEVSDWCVPGLVFCHYAPYDFMLREPGGPKYGIPVPLFNLVYHDCLIEPWMMDKASETEDYMLYALLNGGAPYLLRDGAYPNFDGAFDKTLNTDLEQDIERCRVVAGLHEKVAKCEMLRHEMDRTGAVQKTFFADGTVVTVDFEKQEYRIHSGKEEED